MPSSNVPAQQSKLLVVCPALIWANLPFVSTVLFYSLLCSLLKFSLKACFLGSPKYRNSLLSLSSFWATKFLLSSLARMTSIKSFLPPTSIEYSVHCVLFTYLQQRYLNIWSPTTQQFDGPDDAFSFYIFRAQHIVDTSKHLLNGRRSIVHSSRTS